jgi:cytochrome c-type biogenesis protein CcmF
LFLAGAAPLLAWRKTTRERLWNQFTLPLAAMAVTIGVLVIFFPRTRTLSPVFQDTFKLPISLINFGIIAFVFASIIQEFWRGVGVRRKQTGSDPFTSLIGLMLAKRRKYGGYIVHLGVAIMFFGFAGKAYDKMIDRTVAKPGLVDTATGTGESSFQLGHFAGPFQFGKAENRKGPFTGSDYSFTYERLIHTSDDHMDQITAQVGVYDKGERIATLYPAKRDYHDEQGQMTSEVAISVRLGEDAYLVLTGFELESQQANFRVYVNPLILWVWVGFLMLALGTLICLIPQFVVDAVQWKPTSRLGRAADLAIVLLLAFGIVAGLGSQAYAQGAQETGGGGGGGAAEHIPAGMGMGNAGGGYAAKNRPDTPTAEKAMKELLCPCGCARQDIFACDCATAADLRAKVMAILADYDLNTAKGRKDGYDAVLKVFVKDYSGSVLATPKSSFPWLLPSVAAVGALGLLVFVGRRWMTKKPPGGPGTPTATAPVTDEEYAEKLEDELSETD